MACHAGERNTPILHVRSPPKAIAGGSGTLQGSGWSLLAQRSGQIAGLPWPDDRELPENRHPCSLATSKTGGTSRPRPKSPTVAPSSRRPRHFREGCVKRAFSLVSADRSSRCPRVSFCSQQPSTSDGASFCEAAPRCQGHDAPRVIHHDRMHAKHTQKPQPLTPRHRDASSASIVETGAAWCAVTVLHPRATAGGSPPATRCTRRTALRSPRHAPPSHSFAPRAGRRLAAADRGRGVGRLLAAPWR